MELKESDGEEMSVENNLDVQIRRDTETRPDESVFMGEHVPDSYWYHTHGGVRANILELRHRLSSPSIEQLNATRETRPPPRFSTVNGVYLRCIYNIVSAVYYLRMGTVVGQCGLLLTIAMVLVSAIISTLTTLSMSVLVTNGRVKGGGIYYFISRSLGADWGGTIGVVFSFATAFNAVLQTFGFVEVVQWLMGDFTITKDGKWDTPIIGISLATIQVASISISLTFDFYFQGVMSVVIAASVLSILFGFVNPNTPAWTVSNIRNVLYPSYLPGQNWFSVFAMFFPASCGIMAGANISGDLKQPHKSIPVGTLGAIWTTTILYIITAVILASVADRETLQTDMNILMSSCLWKWIGVAGVLAASVSSSSTALTDGPKIFQALCSDNILPKIFKFFAVGKKGTDDPVRGFVLAYIIVVVCCFIFKSMDTVGLAMTNFFMVSYALVSASCLVGSMSKSPSWRPTWKFSHPITAVLGAGSCITAMFLINWAWALSILAITLVIFGYFHWSETATSNWGEYPVSLMFTDVVQKMEKLANKDAHVKTYRPVIEFVMSTKFGPFEGQIANLLPFKHIIRTSHSVLSVSVAGSTEDTECPEIKGVYVRRLKNMDLGLLGEIVSQLGFGKLSPNILALPWNTAMIKHEDVFHLVGHALDSKTGVAIARGFENIDANSDNMTTIDVWWLVDDGGLLILLAYLLSEHSFWNKCKLRVFAAVKACETLNERHIKLNSLITQFRIPAEVKVVPGMEQDPSSETECKWNDFSMHHTNNESCIENGGSEANTFLRLKEIIHENSSSSSAILCSMPLPGYRSESQMWLSLIDFVTYEMPPFMWVHGGNENVMTLDI